MTDQLSWSAAVGCIADDLTGATDLAGAIQRDGYRVRLCFGPPDPSDFDHDNGAHAIVIALSIRSVPAGVARTEVRKALTAIQTLGVRTFYYKYCSTFDSTDDGNIGPVADEMLALTGSGQCVHAPTYPENGRTVYQGHLFVGLQLLSESSMRHHPRNPMTDPNLVRVLSRQTSKRVALLSWQHVSSGASVDQLRRLREEETAHVIADALTHTDLDAVATSLGPSMPAGGASFGAAVVRALFGHQDRGAKARRVEPDQDRVWQAVVAGSASTMTRDQIEAFTGPVLRLAAPAGDLGASVAQIVDEAVDLLPDGPVLVAAPLLARAQGRQRTSPSDADAVAIERALGRVAAALVKHGVTQLIVAGGETSGAVATALNLRSLEVGSEIAPGVPWTFATDRSLAVAFKSGNFGRRSFFADAFAALATEERP